MLQWPYIECFTFLKRSISAKNSESALFIDSTFQSSLVTGKAWSQGYFQSTFWRGDTVCIYQFSPPSVYLQPSKRRPPPEADAGNGEEAGGGANTQTTPLDDHMAGEEEEEEGGEGEEEGLGGSETRVDRPRSARGHRRRGRGQGQHHGNGGGQSNDEMGNGRKWGGAVVSDLLLLDLL